MTSQSLVSTPNRSTTVVVVANAPRRTHENDRALLRWRRSSAAD
jgi:hypothetical protein